MPFTVEKSPAEWREYIDALYAQVTGTAWYYADLLLEKVEGKSYEPLIAIELTDTMRVELDALLGHTWHWS
jgi:hypothetical protein